jgi:hypothetical protein
MAGKSSCILSVACLLLPALVCGCQWHREKTGGQSLLKKPRMSADSVVLEVFSIHLPRDDQPLAQEIWAEVDEQSLPADTRRRLAENGFRAGIVSRQLPRGVQRLLELDSQARPDANAAPPPVNVVKFDGRPTVRIQQMQLRARKRGEIAVSGIYEQASLLLNEEQGLYGESFEQCQGMLALKSFPQNDGRVRLEVVPEVHYGAPQRRFKSSDGVIELETGRPRKTLSKLAQQAMLSPGDFFVMGSAPRTPGSPGDYFFTDESTSPPQNKLLFVRLAQTQWDDLFAAPAEAAKKGGD